jgi:DNA repair exonuclease SbcCD nuclease subunit
MKPVAVLISDVHYSVHTLPLADAAMRQAIQKANDLGVHLIVAGDIHDTKANLRGECVKAMIDTIQLCKITPIILVGNHDKINEKSEQHSLEFLRPYAHIVDKPNIYRGDKTQTYEYCIPYQHDPIQFKAILDAIPKGARIIAHQGLKNSLAGEYVLDRSAIPSEWVQDYRIISGHYHTRQTIRTGYPEFEGDLVGTWDYIGNPYTLNFAEVNDPEKGYQILMDDGTLQFVPTNLRKHAIIEASILDPHLDSIPKYGKKDLIWVKLTGPKELLAKYNKCSVSDHFGLEQVNDFKLTLIPNDTEIHNSQIMNRNNEEILDDIIDSLVNSDDGSKAKLKNMWREICE